MYLVSACLLGVNCRYDGENNFNGEIYNLFINSQLFPVCPEIMGGLEIPRLPSEIIRTDNKLKVVNIEGYDKSNYFYKGAEKTLKIAETLNVDGAIFMERSPSCGVNKIYDGSFNNNLIKGQGISTKLLRQEGFKVFSDNEIKDINFKN